MTTLTPPAAVASLPIAGLRLAVGRAAVRYPDRDDLVVMELTAGSRCAAVFTRNAFCAAPVTVARHHLTAAPTRYLLVNSGNANAGTGAAGVAAATASCRQLAELTGCRPEQVLPFSTGVIGEYLPVERIAAALPELLSGLDADAWPSAARAIMTTDTQVKLTSAEIQLGERSLRVTGMAKGAGMICPDMATMLAFLATDADVAQGLLDDCLRDAVSRTFNAITVDGDTSTNDACVLVATGAAAGAPIRDRSDPAYGALCAAVEQVAMRLATAIVRDGEGATKLVQIQVTQAASLDEARRVAYCIAHSPLVKTALFASDPNWGRILAAVGRAGVADLDIAGVTIWLGGVLLVEGGARAASYTESAGAAVMAESEIEIQVALSRGTCAASVLTCDLSYEYVRINAEYRS